MAQNRLIADVLMRNVDILKMTLADFTDEEFFSRPVPNANNPAWQVGHLITAEAGMVNGSAGRTVIDLPEGFAGRFTRDTAGTDDPTKLGTRSDLLALYEKVRIQTTQWVSTLTEADLAKPGPERMRQICPTVGHVVQLIPQHAAMHIGQIQVLRRRLGKPVLF